MVLIVRYINFNIKIKRKGMKWQKRWFRWAPRKMQSKMSKCIWTRSASPQRVKLAQHTWQEARQLWIIQRGFRAHSPVQFISIIQIRTRNWDYKLNKYKTLYCHCSNMKLNKLKMSTDKCPKRTKCVIVFTA